MEWTEKSTWSGQNESNQQDIHLEVKRKDLTGSTNRSRDTPSCTEKMCRPAGDWNGLKPIALWAKPIALTARFNKGRSS